MHRSLPLDQAVEPLIITGLYEGDSLTLLERLGSRAAQLGAWVLSRERGPNDTAATVFEFEADSCLLVYSALVEMGLHLSKNSHIQLTTLCNCALQNARDPKLICAIHLCVACAIACDSDEWQESPAEESLAVAA